MEILEKLLESWDRATALSRASLQRRIVVILRGFAPSGGTTTGVDGSLSRAGLGP
jgi:hypothetical protein